jgi:Asp-tRNA(Asn)/Glu-tRNA(Gln) amidotransferase A subunit family amidase
MGFGIGTETMGSVVSPSHRCGTAGLRPTFGRTPRTGVMALCWSLDKVGVLGRSVLDTGMVLSVIQGGDPSDAASLNHGFAYAGAMDAHGMRVGYDPAWFEHADPFDHAALEAARAAGATLIERRVPTQPTAQLGQMVVIEGAAAFEELTLTHADDQLKRQDDNAWPNIFRKARFMSGIDYIQMDRIRRRTMQVMHDAFEGLDCMIGPNFAGGMLVITNMTGNPQLAFRSGFIDSPARDISGRPTPGATPHRVPRASSLWAPLFEERNLIRLGRAIEAGLNVAEERPHLT